MKKLLLGLSLILSTPCAFAANDAHDLSFSAGFGPYFFDSARQLKDTGVPNVSLAFNFDKNWAVEVLFGGAFPDRRDISKSADFFLLLPDAVYRFTNNKTWQPFVMGGVGFSYLKPNGTVSAFNPNGDESKEQANLNAGVGIQYFISDSLAFRADVRDVYTIVRSRNDVFLNFGMSYAFHIKKFRITEDSI